MCGIVGYFRLSGDVGFELPAAVEAARDRLTHRGPDDAGLYVSPDGRCVLGHRRLSILDLSPAGHQPMSNEDDSLWITFNGEIYNFAQLREELIAKGHRFRSSTDTEVILHLYEEEGPALVHRLDGMFAFVIYDVPRRRLFGARDRLGVKPLYLAVSDRRFAFASEPKALLALPDVSSAPRAEELPSYLAFNCLPGPATLYREIEKLGPGTLFEIDGSGNLRREQYWLPGITGERMGGGYAELTESLGMRLAKATEKRMISDVPFGAMLSGGIDSSLTVALMSEALKEPVRTFTVGYPGDVEDQESDLSYARLVARQFGSQHHEVILSDDEILAVLESLPELADDPIGAPSVTANLQLASFTRRSGVTVAQVGEGADEVFCGYGPVHRLWRLHQRLSIFDSLLHPKIAGALARGLGPLLERLGNPSLIGSLDGTIQEHLRRRSRGEHVFWGFGVLFNSREQEKLFARRPASDPYDHLRSRLSQLNGFVDRPYLDQLALIDIVLGLAERLLMRVDKASMLYSLEARVPFLDPSVLEVVFQTPPERRGAERKAFLKAFARGKLPAEVLTRSKVGFPTAQRVFLAPKVVGRIRDSVMDRRFLEFTGFDRARLADFFNAAQGERSPFFYHIWSLHVLSMWFHCWVEGRR